MSHDKKTMIGTVPSIVQQPPGAPTRHPTPRSGFAPGSAPYPVTVPGVLGRSRSDALPAAMPPADGIVGQVLGNYTVRRRLAEGGMGVVYEGEHRQLGRRGAIKVLRLELCGSEDMVERFRQEALAVSAIHHENIVDVFDFGRDRDGRVFFVMEYLEGEPLSARIARGPVSWGEAFAVVEQTLRALKAAHDKGYVHRDLKPDNIWLEYIEGRICVKLLDFGIAKLVGGDSPAEKLTRTGTLIGTPHYMSPEQINGSSAIDHRTDLYALGVIIYEMFAGVTPFVGDTLQAIMTGHLFTEPPRLGDLPANLGVPPSIAELVARMLAKRPDDRYASAADVLDDLHDVHRHQRPGHAAELERARPLVATQSASAAGASPAVVPRRRVGRTALLAGISVAVIAATGAAVWNTRQSPEPRAPVVVPPPVHTEPAPPRTPPPPSYDEIRKTSQGTLRDSLRDPDPAIRAQGSDALGKTRDRESTPELGRLTEHDPDAAVRGHTGEALGKIGASSVMPLLARLEDRAEPALKVYYASALARLGDRAAVKRLIGYARARQLDVSFKAARTLAELSRPGDKAAIGALRALTPREAELQKIMPYAGAVLLTDLAALRDAQARALLRGLLDSADEGARLAAAEGLARLGDDAGKRVLQGVLANQASPNRLVAAVAQLPLGEYGGRDVIVQALAGKDPGARRLAARALGDIGDRTAIEALVRLAGDKEWPVRIAAATAILAILGIDPGVLAQASVDWTRNALDSDDLAVRKAAAGVLADIPVKEAVPLLAKGIADHDAGVRLAVARAAGKIKSRDAAAKVAVAVKAESDPAVKEQEVKALGEIGEIAGAEARTALAEIAEQPGRLGVIAAGSLIAVGDAAGQARLEAAIHSALELRLAAVEAASTVAMQMPPAAPTRSLVVPTLTIGLGDRTFAVRFAAAEGLAWFGQKAEAEPVLEEALDPRKHSDVNVIGRALAALSRLGKSVDDKGARLAEMLDADDPRKRLAAVPIVRGMAPSEAVPLLRRLIADRDPEVRYAGVDAIESVIPTAKDDAVKLYRPLVNDADPVVRTKAAGHLSQLVPPPPPPSDPVKTASALPAPDGAAARAGQAADAALAALTPALDAAVGKLASTDATTKPDEALAAATRAFGEVNDDLTRALTGTRHGDALDIDKLRRKLDDAALKLREAAEMATVGARSIDGSADDAEIAINEAIRVAESAIATAGQAPPNDPSARAASANLTSARSAAKARVQRSRDDAAALWQRAREAAADVDRKLALADRQISIHRTVDPTILMSSAELALGMGKFADARRKLDTAAQELRKTGARNAMLDYLYGQLYRGLADDTADPAAQRALLKQAENAYRAFTRSGSGPNVQSATGYLAEIAERLKAL